MNSEAYIVASIRTAVGKAFKGALRNQRPDDLGAIAVNGVLSKLQKLSPEQIDDVIFGCTYPEGAQGENVARIIAQRAGLPDCVPAVTINRCCSSGLQSIVMAVESVVSGHSDVVVAGGVESMSQVPMGGFTFVPNPLLVEKDPDVYLSMGLTAENVAARYKVSREEQDAFALQSHQRAIKAIEAGKFKEEIIPIEIRETVYNNGKTAGIETTFDTDEGPRSDTSLEALSRLRPAFKLDGTVTAGNSSQMSDGAAAAIIANEDTTKRLGIEPLARLVSYAVAGVAPEVMGIGPLEAIPRALNRAGLELKDIGLIELNEAFASQSLAIINTLGLNEDIVNVNGGAIALGHPLGCTGAKLVATLLHEMIRRKIRYGMCSMCIGGGMGAAGIFENLML